MLRTAAVFLWNASPTWLKVSMAIFLLMVAFPFVFKEWLLSVVRIEVHAAIAPVAKVQEVEVTALKASMSETRADIRAIGIYLMGEQQFSKKSREVAANDGTK